VPRGRLMSRLRRRKADVIYAAVDARTGSRYRTRILAITFTPRRKCISMQR